MSLTHPLPTGSAPGAAEPATDALEHSLADGTTDPVDADDIGVHGLVARFEEQVARTPDAAAVVFAGEALTYATLDRRADRLARHLARLGVGPEVRVGICLGRSLELVVSVLAVLKAGGAYVPLDPCYPAERLAFMLADAGAAVLLTREALRGSVPVADGVRVVAVDAEGEWPAAEPADAPPRRADPRSLAYVIYTSGSTGTPKGVAVQHAELGSYLAWATRAYPGRGAAVHSPLSFDLTVTSLFVPLLCGGTVELVEEDAAVQGLARRLEDGGGYGMLKLTPTHLGALSLLLDGKPVAGGVDCLVVGGETLLGEQLEPWKRRLPGALVVNEYGPTETVVGCCVHARALDEVGAGRVPIGRPAPGNRLYLLDGAADPAPAGAAGELYVGGAQVTRGYLNRPGLTADRFVPDPFAGRPGARMYRTGDQARRLDDGTLEYLGRLDEQVKIRGHRVEPGEVEVALRAAPGVDECVVVAREDAPGERRLVGYVTGGARVEELRAHLRRALPAHMVPEALVRLERLPLTPNGKVDRRALPAPGPDPDGGAYQAPETPVEAALERIWCEVLGRERVSVDQPFLTLGGHSLRALGIIARIANTLGVDVPLHALLREGGSVREVAARVQAAEPVPAGSRAPAPARAPRDRPLPLSFAQEAAWFFEQLSPGQMAYRAQGTIRMRGELDVDALERAITEIVRRHEVFRTTFPVENGVPLQRIHAPWAVRLPLRDVSGEDAARREEAARAVVREEFLRPFDTATLPLVWWSLVRVSADDHVLVMVEHHFVHDGWSAAVFLRELGILYEAYRDGREPALPEPALQFADFAAWQRAWVESDEAQAKLRYWEGALAGVPPLVLPTDFARPAALRLRGARERVCLPPALAAGARALGRAQGATFFMTLLAAFQALLGRYTGQRDFAVGTGMVNRGHVQLEDAIGMIVNTVALRVDLEGDPTTAEVLRRVGETTLRAYEHQDVPFEEVVRRIHPERSSGALPVYQVAFSAHDSPLGELGFGGLALEIEEAQDNGSAKFDLQVTLIPRAEQGVDALADEVVMIWEYNTDLFERATALRVIRHYETLLDAMVREPHTPLSRLSISPPEERRALLAAGRATGVFPVEERIDERFARIAAARPDAVAVTFDGDAPTYAELNARANRLAHRLVAMGVRPETRVGVALERSAELVVALLAVLKAGGAYVPLDPAYPGERIAWVLEDAGAAVLVTTGALLARLPAFDGAALRVDDDAEAIGRESGENPGVIAGPETLAYVIYTSGSTGRPKGVQVTHANVVRLFDATAERFRFGPADVWTLFHSAAFDFSVWEMWGALLHGGRLVVVPWEVTRDPAAFRALLARERVTSLSQTPSAFRALAQADEQAPEPLDALRVVVFGGEALRYESLRGWLDRYGPARPRLVNMYGITETTVHVTAHAVTGAELRAARLGSGVGVPIPDLSVHVLDAHGRPAPAGVPGELCVGGAGPARGYLGRPALTAERFVPDPFSGVPGARLYRSGDLGRWTADGTLEHLGRMDQQVKVRGFRIEPGEVEAALLAHPRVAQAAVAVRGEGDEAALAAYVVPSAAGVEAAELRDALRARLPEHMVPSAFVVMDRLPLTANGKLDRAALPEPGTAAESGGGYVAPRTPAEELLAGIWAEVLRRDRVGVEDDFFALGGHSLLATRTVARVREAFGVELTVRALFEAPTVAALAERVEALARENRPLLPPAVPVARGGALPLSFSQERLWFLDRLQPGLATYNMPTALRLSGELDVPALERALGEVVRRHESLRTHFGERDGAAVQVIAPFRGFALAVDDLSGAGEDEVRRRAEEDGARPFDLARGPLFRARLLRLGAAEHVLLICVHHVVSDGWSMGVLFRELSALYAAYREGREPTLPELPVQYADFAVWQREQLGGAALEGQLAYWRGRLAGAPALLELPTDHPRPAVQGFRGARVPVAFSGALAERIGALARAEGVTTYMVLMAAWQVLLSRYSGSRDVVVGSPIAGRTHGEVEGLIGNFVNTLVVRTELSGAPAFREVLRRVRDAALGAWAHQEVPFERVVAALQPERSLDHAPIFQVSFTLEDGAGWEGAFSGLRCERVDADPGTAKYDLSLSLATGGGEVRGVLVYSADLFERETAERMAAHLERVLEAATADPNLPVARLELMGEAERRQVVEGWSGTRVEYPGGPAVHERIEAHAARAPDAVAVAQAGGRLSYGELNARANRLAHHLRRRGVGPEARVGVLLERGPEWVTALLAVLKAGGAYLPLDAGYPAERLQRILADSRTAVVVTDEARRRILPPLDGIEVVSLDGDAGEIAAASAENPASGAGARSLAYVIYTSGSTGTPKGVAVEHGGLWNLCAWYAETFGVTVADRVTQVASSGFDASVLEVWPCLARGACLDVVPDAVRGDPERLRDWLVSRDVTVSFVPTPLVEPLLRLEWPRTVALRSMHTGGDRLRVRPPAGLPFTLVNLYGPTENTVAATAGVVAPGEGIPSIGTPNANTRAYVLDAGMRPLPVGVPGELCLGGAQVARGYLERPALTAERFVPDPFAGEPGARMYRTGDRVRWRECVSAECVSAERDDRADEPRGTRGDRAPALTHSRTHALEYLGRLDEQVKIRGFRIEPGEIEAALRRHPGVEDCVVVVREEASGERRLVAYVVGAADGAALGTHLRGILPEYMVPQAFVALDRLPLTPHGKLDRRALPAPDFAAEQEGYVAPRTAAEQALAGIWAELLRLERVGVHDGFFELGGDSILSIQVASRARRAGMEITPRQMFECQTIAALAAVAGRTEAADAERAEQGRVHGRVRLTPVQSWFFAREHAAREHFNQSVLLEVDAALSAATLESALHAVLDHHDALRLRFRPGDGGWEQWHADDVGIALERVDLSHLPVAEQKREVDGIGGARQATLELEQGPLGRVVLFDCGERGRVLFIALHHLVVDAVSWRILREDLERACGQIEAGERVDLGAKTTSFRQWGEALEAYASTDALRAEAEYWLAQGLDGVLPLPVDGDGGRTMAHARTVTIALSEEETRALLQEVPAAYRTQINDVLLCALAESVGGWSGSPRIRLALEGHGREEQVGAGVDLTRTVGWFTSIFPVVLDVAGAAGPGERLKRVKEQLRSIPMRGIGYGVLRYLAPDDELRRALAGQASPEIAFNYLGQTGLEGTGRFRRVEAPHGPDVGAENRRAALLEVNGGIADGRLRLRWTYGEGIHRRETIERLAEAYADALRGLIAHCREEGAGGYTPSDFPLAGLSQAELDASVGGRRGVEDLYPLTPLQEGLLYHALQDEDGQAYQVQVVRRLDGGLDVELFQGAWAEAVSRHSILRTAFAWQGLPWPLQRVESSARVPWVVEDWTGLLGSEQEVALERFLAEDRARGFVLGEAPLLRCALFRIGEDAHWFVCNQHHLLLDGWSQARLTAEVLRLYRAWSAGDAAETGRARPYRDYVAWLQRQDQAAAERYWRAVLAGFATPTPLGVDRPAVPGAAARFARLDLRLPAALSQRLDDAARRLQVTLNTVLQGAWGLLLSRYGGERDVVFGNTVAGRPAELEGVEEMVGLFINTLPLRVRVRDDARLGEWLGELQRAQAEAREYEYASLTQVQGWSAVPRGTPLFESLLVFENYPVDSAAPDAGPRMSGVRAVEWTHYPLTLTAVPGRELRLALWYDETRFDAGTVDRMLCHLERVLAQVAADADVRLSRVELTDSAERRALLEERSRTESQPFPARSIHDLFAEQAARTPDAVAVVSGEDSLSYRALDERANRLAHHLARLGAGPEARVALRLERGPEMIVTLLAVLKAGGAYVPLDPAYPAERLAFMLADSGATVLVTEEALRRTLPGRAGVAVVSVDGDASRIAAESSSPPPTPLARPDGLAYVIYTSGSTGTPKGVAVEHRGVVRLVRNTGYARFGPDEVVLQSSAISFDTSTFEIWGALLNGGRLVLVPGRMPSLEDYGRALTRHGVTTAWLTSGLFQVMVEERLDDLRGVRQLLAGGDVVPVTQAARVRARFPECRLINGYGPTENTAFTCCYTIPAEGWGDGSIPIGVPIAHTSVYVLDSALNPAPDGVPGELWTGGAGLARGYLGRPALTAERFVPDPFASEPGARMYRTGDRVRWRECASECVSAECVSAEVHDGTPGTRGNQTPALTHCRTHALEYLGRLDEQVKIRGFRIEPGEVEAVLRRQPGVREAVVAVREDRPGEKRLVAYVVGAVGADVLRDGLRGVLPEHLVPAAFVVLDSLPLTPNGKLDRRALPAPEVNGRERLEPETGLEARVAALWREMLGVEQVGVEDNFFDLGGHSLLLIRMHARVCADFRASLRIVELLQYPTVRALAARLQGDGDAGAVDEGEGRGGARQTALGRRQDAARRRREA
jgi:amino acid adenylation domain-containing protein/non-ribosomal peptide synthase protein (TIGR01720 family)